MENPAPVIKETLRPRFPVEIENGVLKEVSAESVFELVRDIRDPEHPMTLERLGVVSLEDIHVADVGADPAPLCTGNLPLRSIAVSFTPTVPHCSMAGIIGLSILRQLERFTRGFWIRVEVKEGTHSTDRMLSKQLSDRDRVMAAFENEGLAEIIDSCIG